MLFVFKALAVVAVVAELAVLAVVADVAVEALPVKLNVAVIPDTVPPVIATVSLSCVDIVPKEPATLSTKAVVAICVVADPAEAVGAVGIPVKIGEIRLALLATAITKLLNSVSNSDPLIIFSVEASGNESFLKKFVVFYIISH